VFILVSVGVGVGIYFATKKDSSSGKGSAKPKPNPPKPKDTNPSDTNPSGANPAQTEAAAIENKRQIIANKNQAIQALTNLRKDVITKHSNLHVKTLSIIGLYGLTEWRLATTPEQWLQKVNAIIDARTEASNSAKAFAEKLIYAIEMARAEQRKDGNLVLASSKVNEAITAMTNNINNKVNEGLTAMRTNIDKVITDKTKTKIQITNIEMTEFNAKSSDLYSAIYNDDKNLKVNPSTSELEEMLVNAQKFAEHHATAYAMSLVQKTNLQMAGHIATM